MKFRKKLTRKMVIMATLVPIMSLVIVLVAIPASAINKAPALSTGNDVLNSPDPVAIPTMINYQGYLTDAGGDPINDTVVMIFSIYETASGGTALWQEKQSVTVSKGLFHVLLGSIEPINFKYLTGESYLGIQVGSDPEMKPRQQIVSVAYAFHADKANDADTLDGLDSSDIDDLYLNEIGPEEMNGAGMQTTLLVTNEYGDAMAGITNSVETYSCGVSGWAQASEGETRGVYGLSNSPEGSGVYGEAPFMGVRGYASSGSGAGVYGYSSAGKGVYGASSSSYGVYGHATGSNGIAGYFKSETGYGLIVEKGKVGIGTTSPIQKLELYGDENAFVGMHITNPNTGDSSSEGIYFTNEDGTVAGIRLNNNDRMAIFDNRPDGYITFHTQGLEKVRLTNNGNFGIGITNPSERLEVKGNVLIRSSSTGEEVIELGEGLDYAEGFDVTDSAMIVPGTVLIIDPNNPGKLTVSNSPYDTKVAGIVAGAKGMGSGVRLGSDNFDYDVALAGRVYCNVDATYGEVSPGDLLTTSPAPGYAMVVRDYEKAQGAILGKAMEGLPEGEKGQILVLVTLQ